MFARGWQTWDLARSHESLLGGNDAAPGTGDVDRVPFLAKHARTLYTNPVNAMGGRMWRRENRLHPQPARPW